MLARLSRPVLHVILVVLETIIDLDIANYFGTIDHGLLEAMLREKIQDERFMRYIPTVCLDAISLVAISCGYDSG